MYVQSCRLRDRILPVLVFHYMPSRVVVKKRGTLHGLCGPRTWRSVRVTAHCMQHAAKLHAMMAAAKGVFKAAQKSNGASGLRSTAPLAADVARSASKLSRFQMAQQRMPPQSTKASSTAPISRPKAALARFILALEIQSDLHLRPLKASLQKVTANLAAIPERCTCSQHVPLRVLLPVVQYPNSAGRTSRVHHANASDRHQAGTSIVAFLWLLRQLHNS